MEQHEEVLKVDAEMRPFRVFHGTEMEIRADGELDFPDDVLEKLDFVIASLHQGLRQPREQVTARILNAINNPHVDLIGHPRGQLILERDPADLDMEAVFAAAKKSGIALEINANPHRLDLEAPLARRAVEMGIPLCIDTDAHAIDQMDLLRYGIMTARRGWVEAALGHQYLAARSISRMGGKARITMPDKQDDTQNLSGTQPVNLPEWQPAPPTPPTPPPPMPTPPAHADARQRTRAAGVAAL